MTECLIHNKYRIIEKIGNGKFGTVFKGVHKKTSAFVAVKCENKSAVSRTLCRETKILNYLYKEGIRNTPPVLWYGLYGDNLCLVMPLYEFSLLEWSSIRELSKPDLYKIISDCVRAFSSIHKQMVIHRDVKPENIMFKNGELYIIDFGLAVFYKPVQEEEYIGKFKPQLTGTPKWMSFFQHQGCCPSFKDDLISISYILLFLLNGRTLPWEKIDLDDPDKKNEIRQSRKSFEKMITHHSDPAFLTYTKFCYDLSFDCMPDYDYLIDIFKNDIKKSY